MGELGERVGIVPAVAFSVLVSFVCAAAALLLAGCRGAPPTVAYDLAALARVAERWSQHDVILFLSLIHI